MKIDIDKYNKRLLAIIGTTAIVLTLGAVLIGSIAFVVDQVSRANRRDQTDVITVEDKVDSALVNTEPVIRKYEISMHEMELIDSASATYIIPVGHVKLQKEELIDGETTNFGSGSSKYVSGKKFSRGGNYGFFNNMILYRGKEETSQVIFKSKTLITSYYTLIVQGEMLVVFMGVNQDSNGDKSFTERDYKSLFIYHVNSGKLDTVSVEGSTIMHSIFLPDLNSLTISAIADKNGNGEMEVDEPKRLYKYDFLTKKLTPTVAEINTELLQNMLDK